MCVIGQIYLFFQNDLTNKLLRLNQKAKIPDKFDFGDLFIRYAYGGCDLRRTLEITTQIR